MNMGPYFHISPRMVTCLASEGREDEAKGGRIAYAGRAPSAATATGYHYVHLAEEASLVDQALNLENPGNPGAARAADIKRLVA